MADGAEVARAYVTIVPRTDGSSGKMIASVVGAAETAGADAGRKMGAGMQSGIKGFAGGAGKLLAAAGAVGAAAFVGGFVRDSIEAGRQFDASMSQVAATMGTTVDQIGELRDFAKEMGATTAFSASQAADALNYMALAGYDAETSMKMLPNVLNLAASGGMELATASDMVTDAQSALGLSIDQTTEMVDQMAKTASTTNTSVSQLGSAFLTVGGTAKMMRGGTAELSQVLGLLADNGVKGSEGGTALRNILLSLASPTDNAAKMLADLGVSVFDADGKMRDMKDIVLDLNSAMDGMTDEQRTNAIATIFNKRDLKSVNALLGTSAERWDEVAESIGNAQGAAEKMAETQLDNLEGDLTIFQSAVEGAQIALSEALEPALRSLVQFATDNIGTLTEMFQTDAFREFASNVAELVTGFAKAGVGILTGFAKGLSAILGVLRPMLPVLTGVGTALLVAYKPAKMLAGAMPSLSKGLSNAALGMATMATEGGKLQTGLLKAGEGASKLGGIAAGAMTAGIMAAVAAITIIVSLVSDAIAKHEAWVKATDGVVRASETLGAKGEQAAAATGKIADSLADAAMAAGDSTAAIGTAALTADELIQKQGELADTISGKFRDTEETNATLAAFAGKIAELAGNCDGSAEKLSALQGYLDGYNEIAGTSYSITDDFTGALDVNTGELLENAEAFKARARAAAAQEVLTDMYKQQFEIESSLAQAQADLAAAETKAAEEAAVFGKATDSTMAELGDAQNAVRDYTAMLESNETAIGNVADTMADANAAAAGYSAQGIAEAIRGNEDLAASLDGAGYKIENVSEYFDDLGLSAEQMASLTSEEAVKLAGTWDKSIDEIVQTCGDFGIELPKSVQGAMSAAAAVTKAGGSKAASEWVYSMTAGQYQMVSAAAQASGMSVAQFVTAAERIGHTGSQGVADYAQGILDGTYSVSSAASAVASAASGPLASIDASRWGWELGQDFAAGMKSAIGAVVAAVTSYGDAVHDKIGFSLPKDEPLRNHGRGPAGWGVELVDSWITGIESAMPMIDRAMTGLADYPAGYLATQKGIPLGTIDAPRDGRAITINLAYNASDDARDLARGVMRQLELMGAMA